jgi:hypothetical protein
VACKLAGDRLTRRLSARSTRQQLTGDVPYQQATHVRAGRCGHSQRSRRAAP